MSRSREDHTAWQELIAAHALHALDGEEEAILAVHLAECDECRIELDAHSLTAARLASLADDPGTAPPAWSKLRSGVIGEEAAPLVVDLAERRTRGRTGRWLLGAAAVAVLVTGATVGSWQVLRSDRGNGIAASSVVRCQASNGCLAVDLRSSDGSRRASVLITDGVARVQPISMAAAASGRTFVLWQLPRSGGPIPLGEFDSSRTLSGSSKLAVPMSQTTGFAVSSEPSGPLPGKPSDVLALGGITT